MKLKWVVLVDTYKQIFIQFFACFVLIITLEIFMQMISCVIGVWELHKKSLKLSREQVLQQKRIVEMRMLICKLMFYRFPFLKVTDIKASTWKHRSFLPSDFFLSFMNHFWKALKCFDNFTPRDIIRYEVVFWCRDKLLFPLFFQSEPSDLYQWVTWFQLSWHAVRYLRFRVKYVEDELARRKGLAQDEQEDAPR